MKDELILRYTKATVNFYGIVHIDKFVEIYNLQNEYKIDNKEMKAYIEEYKDHLLQNHYICVKDNYFVSLIITAGERFKEELKLRKGKPYYIPEKEELLKYEDPFYFEITSEYIELRDYLRKLYWRKSKADEIADEIKSYCSSTHSFINLIDVLVNIKVKNDSQFEDIKLLSMQLYKNTRLGEYNGSTYLEVYT